MKKASYTAVKNNPSYHPGRCAKVLTEGGVELAVFGQIHPLVAADYGLGQPVYCATVDFEALWENANTVIDYKPLPKFPAVTRDIAVVCKNGVTVGQLTDCIRRGAKGLLKEVVLFDIYTGTGIPEGKKSVAFRVILRAPDRTLTVEEADKVSNKIIKDLKFKLGLNIRK